MSQILNFADERSRASEVAEQARVAVARHSPCARELSMAADADRQNNQANEPGH